MSSSARIEELRQKFDDNPRRYFAPLANEYRKGGDLEQAIFICQEYLPQQPGHMSGHIVFGQALYEARRNDEARAVFETALTLDPENLIALRHLGDIARDAGDIDGARSWYTRGLDADPRNEEMSAVLAALPPVDGAGAVPVATGGSDASEATDILGLNAALSADLTETPVATLRVDPAPTIEIAVPTPPVGIEAMPEVEPPADVGFDDIGVTPTAMASSSDPVEPAVMAADIEFTAMDLGGAADAAPPAMEGLESHMHAAAPPMELDADLIDESGAEVTAGRDEAFEPISLGATPAPAEPEAVPTAAGYAVPTPIVVDAVPEPIAVDALTAPAEATPFDTETMALLYLSQGHRDEALAIYGRLTEQRPDDEALRARYVAALSGGDAAESTGPTEEVVPSSNEWSDAAHAVPMDAQTGGPTIRELLQSIFGSPPPEPMSAPSATEPDGVTGEMVADADLPAVEATLLESTVELEMVEALPADGDGDTEAIVATMDAVLVDSAPAVSDEADLSPADATEAVGDDRSAIDALFEFAPPTPDDLAAARVLADAFSISDDEAAPLRGMPAHRASAELSLDSVFRSDGGSRRPDGPSAPAFALDQFFSAGTGGGTGTTTAGGASAVGEAPAAPPDFPVDDVEQFNSWLTGLKKT